MSKERFVPRMGIADLAFVNGKVITVDGDFSVVQAVAVEGDSIVAVGTDEEIKPLIGRHTNVFDLKGKTMLPGINDAHIHAALYGGTRPPLTLDVGYPTVKSIDDIVKAVAEKAKTAKPGEWIRGMGWDEGYLEECLKEPGRYPNRWDLDAVSPDNPVLLGHYTQHEVWVNSRTMEIAGINRDTPTPEGGIIVKDPDNGEPTGVFREFPAQALVMKAVPLWTKEEKRRGMETMIQELNSLGITSITEGALGSGGEEFQGGLFGSECIGIYDDLLDEGKLTLRVGWLYLFGEYGACTYDDFRGVIPQLGIHSGFGNEWLHLAGVKIFADGTPMSKTAWMHDDYPDGSGHGSLVIPGGSDEERRNELIKMICLAHRYGLQVGVHAIGGRAIEATIDGFLQGEREDPKGLRHYVIHADFISDEYIKLAAEHGFGLGVQPILKWTFSDAMDKLVGIELSTRQFPLRKLIDAGVHLSAGSDAPVVYPSWQAGIQGAVLRESKATGTVRGPDQRISVEEAIRMYTIEGAWQERAENVKGSIEPGKLADMCVIDQDILSIEPHGIKDIKNLMTVVGGKVVFNSLNEF
jgi:predicted amidohydrolase YtcJ